MKRITFMLYLFVLSIPVFAEDSFIVALELEGFSFHEAIESEELSKVFSEKFHGLFDEVSDIKMSTDLNCAFYYYVEGFLGGQPTYEIFKVGLNDIENGSYSYIDTDKDEFQLATEYCRDYSMFPGCPVTGCNYGYNCKGAICGYVSSNPPYLCIVY